MAEIITKRLWVIIIVFIIVIVGVFVYVDFFEFNKSEEPKSYILLQDVVLNYRNYLGKNITIRGFYYKGDLPNGEAYITSDHVQLPIHDGSFENTDYLTINTSGFDFTFAEDTEYYITGTLTSNVLAPYQIQLYALSAVNVIPT